MNFYSYGSSSRGNCYLIEFDSYNIVFDMGLNSFDKTKDKNMTKWHNVEIVLISHEHSDHTKYLLSFLKFNNKAIVIINEHCYAKLVHLNDQYKNFKSRFFFTQTFKSITNSSKKIWIYPFKITHNSIANNGYVICHQNKKILYITDCGSLDYTKLNMNYFNFINLFLVESNHLEELPIMNYKEETQYSNIGHFSRIQALDLLTYIKQQTTQISPKIVFIHTSKDKYPAPMHHDKIYDVLGWKYTRAPMDNYYEIEDI